MEIASEGRRKGDRCTPAFLRTSVAQLDLKLRPQLPAAKHGLVILSAIGWSAAAMPYFDISVEHGTCQGLVADYSHS